MSTTTETKGLTPEAPTPADSPHGGCRGWCAGCTISDEAREEHDEFVDYLTAFQTDGDLSDLTIALELLARRERSRGEGVPGLPVAEEFAIFVSEHNWPEPGKLASFSRAIVSLVESAVDAEQVARENRRKAGLPV